jgi:hypothetical protein
MKSNGIKSDNLAYNGDWFTTAKISATVTSSRKQCMSRKNVEACHPTYSSYYRETTLGYTAHFGTGFIFIFLIKATK